MLNIDIINKMGAEILEQTPNFIKVKLPLAPNVNHVNMMYAGSLFSLAEFPVGVLLASRMDLSKVYPVVAEMSIKYKKPAFGDVTVAMEISDAEFERLETEALRDGKSTIIMQQELRDQDGTIVAVTEGRYVCLRA